MASRVGASLARRLSSIFFSTTPSAKPPKPACRPKALAGEAGEKSSKGPVSQKPLAKVLKAISRQRDPDKLVSQFIAASTASPRFRDDNGVYEVAVSRLSSFGRHDAVAAIIDSQKPFLEASGEGFAARLVRLYGLASMPSHAAATFFDLPPNHKTVLTFNALLVSWIHARDFDALVPAFQQIPASHPTVVPDVRSYNILISGLCQKPDLSAALDVIQLMETCGLTPDVVSFNTLLNAFYRSGRFSDAEKVWEVMKDRNVEPNVKSYNAKLRALVSEGRTDDAIALFERMQKDGTKPDTVSYNELIRGCCREGRLDEAKKVYYDLVKNECAPNMSTFHILIPHFMEAGDLDLVVSFCNAIFSSKCRVKCWLLQRVVTALVAASRVEEAKRIVELGRMNPYSPQHLVMPPCAGEVEDSEDATTSGKENDVEAETNREDFVPYEEGCEEECESKNVG